MKLLDQLSLEPFPLLRKQVVARRWPVVEVAADSMRVGKTTAVSVLGNYFAQQGVPVTVSYEDWENNPYLKMSYEDPQQHLLDSQEWFIQRKWEQLSQIPQVQIVIQDVPPESDYVYPLANYVLGRMGKTAFERYDRFYQSLDWGRVSLPHLLVYLKVSEKELLRRAKAHLRDFETVDEDYFLVMRHLNRRWLGEMSGKTEILEIDTDSFDFSRPGEAQDQLGQMVAKRLTVTE